MKKLTRALRCAAVALLSAAVVTMAGCAAAETYTPELGEASLESPTIGEDGVLRVGVDSSNAPLAGTSSSTSSLVGIDVDFAAALADHFGLTVEVVDVGSDASTALSEGTVDIVLGIDVASASDDYWSSDAYLSTAVALFALEGADATVPTNDDAPVVAAQVSSKSAWAVTNEFESGTLTTTSNLEGAFEALEAGDVQYVAADAVIGTFAANSVGLSVQIVALMEETGGYCVAVSDDNDDLKQAVADAVATLSTDGTIEVIEKKWLGTALSLEDVALTDEATSSGDESEDEDDDDAEEAGSNAVSVDEVE